MVLESIIDPKSARSNPWLIVLLAFVFVTVGIFAADYLEINKSIIAITLVSMPAIPFIWKLFDYSEGEIENSKVLGSQTLARHMPAIIVMAALFLGLIIGFTFWYFALPAEKSAEIFAVQVNELKNVQSSFAGYATYANGTSDKIVAVFEKIFFHNLIVLLIILFFSLLYSSGAVLVLTWNASVISVFIGNYAKSLAGSGGALWVGVGTGFLGLLPHGTFELGAYLLAALAGGILSIAITREAHKTNSFELVMHDSVKLVAWSILLLAVGALIESGAIAG